MNGYDGALQMFKEPDKPVDFRRLWYVRYLLNTGRIDEHPIFGAPSGPLADEYEAQCELARDRDPVLAGAASGGADHAR